MAKRNVVWTKTADIQFSKILRYWTNRNKSNVYPKKLLKLVTERTKQIAKNPYIYKSTEFKDTRVASMGHFSIFYKIREDDIIITAFWDNREDPVSLLKVLSK